MNNSFEIKTILGITLKRIGEALWDGESKPLTTYELSEILERIGKSLLEEARR